ncbi:MAG TPA: bacillithiol system redox-active protein YtxJ [Balneolaceae bacterium]|nr:bacillithiol system redox-active protein YtxJ [Balneolaceae bacterium]
MGIFSSLRSMVGSRQEESELWNQPQTAVELDDILDRTQKPQVIYKHSYSCAVSLFSKSSLESELEKISEHADVHLIDVIAQRSLSNEISQKTGIRHESPQVILLHNGSPFWSASHGNVRAPLLIEALSELENPDDTNI